MSQAEQYQQQIIAGINDLPADKLAEVAEYVSFLRQKYNGSRKKKIVKLGGLWKGVDPSIVWQIIQQDLPQLRTSINNIINDY